MTSTPQATLAERRQELCQRLQAQRQVVAQRLESGFGGHAGYARSMTMRFLAERPLLIVRLLVEIAKLLKPR